MSIQSMLQTLESHFTSFFEPMLMMPCRILIPDASEADTCQDSYQYIQPVLQVLVLLKLVALGLI